MTISSESKLFMGIIGATIGIIVIAVFFMSQPAKPVAKDVLLQNAVHTLGPKDAQVYLVEFSDYQCPACGIFYPAVKKLTDTYKDSLFFVYRNYPLPAHTLAIPSARAAEAAAMQGKYWEMHDLLFTGQKELNDAFIASQAAILGLDMKKFEEDKKSASVQAIIDTDTQLGDSIGISATPTFYLNGVQLQLNSVNDLITAVEKELKK